MEGLKLSNETVPLSMLLFLASDLHTCIPPAVVCAFRAIGVKTGSDKESDGEKKNDDLFETPSQTNVKKSETEK